jgi:signal-transduction protein with cAMP-binding, CBS, and nucleotidyltransferase domain
MNCRSGTLTGVITASDLRGLSVLHLEDLNLTVAEYMSSKNRNLVTITSQTTFKEALIKFVDAKVHHLWFIDEKKKPAGVLTMTDIFKRLYSAGGF